MPGNQPAFAEVFHGTILGGLSTVPDLEQAVAAYRDVFGLELIDRQPLPANLAASWGCPANSGAAMAVLRPQSGEPCWVRLVEQPPEPDFVPTTTFGWAAFEFTVEDVWRWPDRLPANLFEIVGAPRNVDNLAPTFIPMQVLGPGRELLYLNQVLADPPDAVLPRARSPVDRIFIVVLAAKDRLAAVDFYADKIGLDRGPDYTLAYSTINKAFSLPADTSTTISMMHSGLHPIVEIDDYPAAARDRPRQGERLPPGNALVTLAVTKLDDCKVDWIAPPAARDEAPYNGRLAATTIGPSGELIELIEIG